VTDAVGSLKESSHPLEPEFPQNKLLGSHQGYTSADPPKSTGRGVGSSKCPACFFQPGKPLSHYSQLCNTLRCPEVSRLSTFTEDTPPRGTNTLGVCEVEGNQQATLPQHLHSITWAKSSLNRPVKRGQEERLRFSRSGLDRVGVPASRMAFATADCACCNSRARRGDPCPCPHQQHTPAEKDLPDPGASQLLLTARQPPMQQLEVKTWRPAPWLITP